MAQRNSVQPNGAYVRFISRYRGETDYGVTLPGHREEYRVTRNEAGEYPRAEVRDTPDAAIASVNLFLAAEEREYQEWRKQRPDLFPA